MNALPDAMPMEKEADIHFGTDGWRAVIAENFTFANLRRVTQAVAQTILEQHDGGDAPQIVVGYDTRFLSDRFAAEVACVLAGNGIIAWLTRTDAPTPSISHNVRARGAAAGIVITASHNPPRYNGFQAEVADGRRCDERRYGARGIGVIEGAGRAATVGLRRSAAPRPHPSF